LIVENRKLKIKNQELKSALIVFAKEPRAGKVKTRLSPFLSPEEGAKLYAAFLQDALQQYTAVDADIRVYLGGEKDTLPAEWLPPNSTLHHQKGIDLGERMLNAFVESFVAKYQRLVIIGTDHPTLPTDFIHAAFDVLQHKKSVVLGGSEDGGFYLLGMNHLYAEAFEEMNYSHENVLEDTLDRLDETDADITLLPEWYDIDVPQDLIRLEQDLQNTDEPLIHTRKMMQKLSNRIGVMR
jgi:uncharacterized protein